MTLEEFSNSFDTLLNSYNVQANFGEGSNKQGGIALDEYEKSVLLTQAQDIIVKSYFDRSLNNQGQGFDDSTKRQVDFSSLIKVKHYDKTSETTNILEHDDDKCYDDRGLLVTLDRKILFVLNERFEVNDSSGKKVYVVVPINYKEYDREMSKAYAQPLKKQAWRLFSNAATGYDIQSEIIPIFGTTVATSFTTTTTYYKVIVDSATEAQSYWAKDNEGTVEGGYTDDFVQNNLTKDDGETKYQNIAEAEADGWSWHKGDVTLDWEETTLGGGDTVKGTVSSKGSLPDANTLSEGDIYAVITTTAETNEQELSYVIRYVERPTPIILRTLPNELSIDDYNGSELVDDDPDKKIFTGNGINCSLNPVLHMDILNKAFELAVTTRGGGQRNSPQELQRDNSNRQ